MKITRKAIVSLVAASAIAMGSVNAPATAQNSNTPTTSATATTETPSNLSSNLKAGSSDDKGDLSPKKLGEWIAIVTTIIGVLSSILTFATKLQTFNR